MMKKRLRITSTLVFICCIAGLFSCSKAESRLENQAAMKEDKKLSAELQSEDVIVLRYGDVNPEGNVIVKSAHFFADRVKELTNGHVEIDIYPSGQLGDDSQYYSGLQMGALDIYRGNSATMSEMGELEVSALTLPYVFRDREHFWKVCNSELGREILQDIQESGTEVVGLCYLDEGPRNFFTTRKEVTQISDLQNLKIRSMYSDVLESTITSFGAIPTPIVYAELYTALSSGRVDGAENPVTSYWSNKYYEVAPYYVRDEHMYAPSILLMSELTWNNLSEEDQAAIRQAADMTEDYNRQAIEKEEENAYRQLKNAGVTIVELTDKENWQNAVKPVYEKYGSKWLNLIQEIKEMK